jgi:F0F1-type ATP synthase assembly protein I
VRSDDDRKLMARSGRASAVGWELAISIVGGLLVGWWVDERRGSSPLWTLVGLGFGTFTGFYALFRTAQQMQRDAADEASRDRRREERGEPPK